jgi:hypothetical protein
MRRTRTKLYTRRYLRFAPFAPFGAIFFGCEFLRPTISKLIMRLPTPHKALADMTQADVRGG